MLAASTVVSVKQQSGVCLSVCLPVCLSVCPPVCLSILQANAPAARFRVLRRRRWGPRLDESTLQWVPTRPAYVTVLLFRPSAADALVLTVCDGAVAVLNVD